MAPSRAGSPPVPPASAPPHPAKQSSAPPMPLPLPRRLIRQIQRRVADSGRQLRRLEVGGHVLDNFDTLDAGSEDSSSDETPSPPHLYPPPLRQPYAPVQPQQQFRGPVITDRIVSPTTTMTTVTTNGDHDDDLTSLTWLQDKNLLSGINLSKDGDDLRPLSIDFSSQPALDAVVPASPCNTPPPSAARLPPTPGPPAPLVNVPTKPPYSFSCLIFMAIEASPARALPVKDIYAWIIKHFPYFRGAPQGWKNSVRHNLSLNKCFQKVNKGGNTNGSSGSIGKGSLWTVDPVHRPALLQAFTRAPPPHHLTVSPPPPATPPTPPPPPVSPPPSNNHLHTKGAPDPQLFPFLARRLAAGSENDSRNEMIPSPHNNSNGYSVGGPDVMDEYAAAAIVLQMKHGPGVLLSLPNRNPKRLDYSSDREELITSSPSQDHAYIAGDGIECPETSVECILGSTSPVHCTNNHQPIKYTAAIYQRGLDEPVELKKESRWRRSSVDPYGDGEEEDRHTAEVLLSLAAGYNGGFGPVRSRARRRRPPPR